MEPALLVVFEDDEVETALNSARFYITNDMVVRDGEPVTCESCDIRLYSGNVGHILPYQGEYIAYCTTPACVGHYLSMLI